MPELKPDPKPEKTPGKPTLLYRLLRAVGYVTLLAFAAAVMPSKWIVESSEWLGFDPYPDSPLTFYLARHLSLLYGFVGVLLLFMIRDLPRYLPIARLLGWCAIALGVGQLVCDAMASLPWWWTLGESLSTIFGGGLILYCVHREPTGDRATIAPNQDLPHSER